MQHRSTDRATSTSPGNLLGGGLQRRTESPGNSTRGSSIQSLIAKFILQYKPGQGVKIHEPMRGTYNVFYPLTYEDGTSVGLRVPCEGESLFTFLTSTQFRTTLVDFLEEKIYYEVGMMRYVSANTTIPIPKIYHHGVAAENTVGLGPFIIMDCLEHEMDMSDVLDNLDSEMSNMQALDNISGRKLDHLYRQMANILLQLSHLSFHRIGSLTEDTDDHFTVSSRPLIPLMNALARRIGADSEVLPSCTYSTSKEWYCALADMHLTQLICQSNNNIINEDDARDRYVARLLFRMLAYDGRLTSALGEEEDSPTFRIYSEDLRPANVLLDKDFNVSGVIDWEFAYVAPAAFSFDPPWWLLLGKPEDWPGGYEGWMKSYEPRLRLFLRVLEEEESKTQGIPTEEPPRAGPSTPLSQRMRRSWESKTWMINYAARNDRAFDYLYWKYLDSRFFGPNENQNHRARLSLFTKKEIEMIESFVKSKMKKDEEDQDYIELAEGRVADLLAEFSVPRKETR
ncbi:hypothetical protein F5Y14DRAFT_422521 [Nemania sp. NC0429]|nr:hypothetical protein F5Y14DRAFT_422521 [Nemania sp. NC0429]